MYKNLKYVSSIVLVLVLILIGAFIVVNAQGQDSSGKPALDNKDTVLYDAQIYASNNNVSTEEALRRFQVQDIAGKLDGELSKNETGTFAGLWVEHTPEFKVVVQFTRDSEEIIRPYLKQYLELADIVEVRPANVSLANLQRDQADASSSVGTSGIRVPSEIDVHENSVKLYLAKADKSRFDDALQRKEIRLPDTVRVITVDALAEEYLEASSSPAAQASQKAPGFGVILALTGLLVVMMRRGKNEH